MNLSDFIKDEDIQKNILYPIGTVMYNEIYIYIWLLCIYNVLLICIVLVNFFLLLHHLNVRKHLGAVG